MTIKIKNGDASPLIATLLHEVTILWVPNYDVEDKYDVDSSFVLSDAGGDKYRVSVEKMAKRGR